MTGMKPHPKAGVGGAARARSGGRTEAVADKQLNRDLAMITASNPISSFFSPTAKFLHS